MMERMINVWDTAVCHGSVENLTIIYSAAERRCVTHDAAARFSRFVSRVAASICLNRKSCTQMLETARDSTLECSCNDSSCLLQQFAASRNGSDAMLGILYSLGIPKALQNLVATTDMFHCKWSHKVWHRCISWSAWCLRMVLVFCPEPWSTL